MKGLQGKHEICTKNVKQTSVLLGLPEYIRRRDVGGPVTEGSWLQGLMQANRRGARGLLLVGPHPPWLLLVLSVNR